MRSDPPLYFYGENFHAQYGKMFLLVANYCTWQDLGRNNVNIPICCRCEEMVEVISLGHGFCECPQCRTIYSDKTLILN
jgi:hypothetical protein